MRIERYPLSAGGLSVAGLLARFEKAGKSARVTQISQATTETGPRTDAHGIIATPKVAYPLQQHISDCKVGGGLPTGCTHMFRGGGRTALHGARCALVGAQ